MEGRRAREKAPTLMASAVRAPWLVVVVASRSRSRMVAAAARVYVVACCMLPASPETKRAGSDLIRHYLLSSPLLRSCGPSSLPSGDRPSVSFARK